MNSNDPLSTELQRWQHRPVADPQFCTCVWSRIRACQQESGTEHSRVRFFNFWQTLSLGKAALLAFTGATLLGSSAAFAYDTMTRDERQATAFVRSIDPVHISAKHVGHNGR